MCLESLLLIARVAVGERNLDMDGDLTGVTPCSSLAFDGMLRVGTAGAIWGLCSGPHEARKLGLNGISRASFVAKSAGKYSFQCGLVAGVFTMTQCGIQRYRKKSDWMNALIGGAVAGAVVAAGTRSWTQVIGMAGIVSAFSTVADYSKTN